MGAVIQRVRSDRENVFGYISFPHPNILRFAQNDGLDSRLRGNDKTD